MVSTKSLFILSEDFWIGMDRTYFNMRRAGFHRDSGAAGVMGPGGVRLKSYVGMEELGTWCGSI
jgi:hypothetical protein